MNPLIQDIGNKLIISLATLAVVRIFLLIVKSIQNRVVESQSFFTLTGYWIASYKDLRTPESGANHREIIRFKQRGEELFFQYEHHNSNDTFVTRGDGRGFVRSNEIYLFYKRQNLRRGSGGVLIMTIELTPIRMPYLEGIFIERDRTNPDERIISVPYTAKHIEMPFAKRIRMLCRKQAFRNYAQVIQLETVTSSTVA